MLRNFGLSKLQIFWTLVLLILALFLRVYNLNSIPVFGDEAIYIRWSQIMQEDATMRFLPLSDGKQPLYMWVVIPFLKAINDPLIAGRIVSVFTGFGTLIGVFVLTYSLFENKQKAFIASVLYALSPYAVFFDRLALADSMLTFFGIWTLVFGVFAVKNLRLDFSMLAGFAFGGALLTKSPAIIFGAMLPLTTLINKKNIIKSFIYLIPTYLIAYGMYNILRLGPQFHMISIRNMDYVYPLNHFFLSPFDPLKPHFFRSLEYLWLLGPSVLLGLIVLGFIHGIKSKPITTLIIFVFAIFPIIIVSEYSRVLTARYILFTLPYLFVLASLSKNGIISKVLISAFFLHSITINFFLLADPQKVNLPLSERSGFLEAWTSGYGIKEVSQYLVNAHKDDGKRIYIGTEGFFGTLPDGLQIYLKKHPKFDVFGTGVDFGEVPKRLIELKASGEVVYFVVNSSRLHRNYKELPLKLIASYPKAAKTDGTYDSLYFFEIQNVR